MLRRVHNQRNYKRSRKILLSGQTFMSLEEAVAHYMSDGNVNLPQAPEGAFEFDSAPGADSLRGTIQTDFDRFEAAVMMQDGSFIQPVTPSPSPSPGTEPTPPAPAPPAPSPTE